ncbi:MAG TPA: hypothetical protein VNJ05_02000 [Sphingomicrobium sp.]|nr:hypothetical protein [Sphingomicrobium sp.]
MRALLIAMPLLLGSAPALAAAKEAPQLPPELSNPAMADKLGRMMGALTRALMDMPVGELEAVAEGREPTPADRTKRVRDHLGGPGAEREVEAKVAASGRQMQAMTKALVASLPAIMKSLEGVERELERATANLPDPTYPRR